MHQPRNKLTFVLTLALSGTGRDEQDLKRTRFLLETFAHFFEKQSLEQFIVVSPGRDMTAIREAIAPEMEDLNGLIIDENEVCPEFQHDPNTVNAWPKPNQGWFRQQLLKLAVHERVKTPFYMTLDSDVIFVKPFGHNSLIRGGKADVNIQTEVDFKRIYREETVAKEVRVRRLRYEQVEPILGCRRQQTYLDRWYGETPVLLNRAVVEALVEHLENVWERPWRQCLLEKLPWNEYPLYFLFAEDQKLLERYYRAGNADTVLCLTDSLWQPADEYRIYRNLANWNPEPSFRGKRSGVAVVVQSYLGYEPDEVVKKVRPLLKSVHTGQQVAVSVIVPVFNVQEFVAQCLDSLIEQDLANLEIIVVNDGSSDRTLDIVEKYAKEHDSIRLVNQENQGLSAARNAGIGLARGQFVGFVDGDDWVDKSMYGAMFTRAVETGADIVITNGQLYDQETGELKPIQDFRVWDALHKKNADLLFDPAAEPDVFMLDTSACKRLFRKSFLKEQDFRFPDGKIFEDVSTHYQLLLRTNLITLLDEPFYYYRTNRPGRITARKNESLLQVFDVMNQVIDELEKKDANDVIWANFIWFQNWVLRWLRRQIDPEFSTVFDRACVEISKRFRPGAVKVFKQKFANERHAVEFVNSQLEDNLAPVAQRSAKQEENNVPKDTLHLGNDPEGIFNHDSHTYMPDIWGWVCLQFDVRSVLDIGCGMGSNLAWFNEYGFEVLGVEGHPNAVAQSLVPGRIVQHDFSEGPWFPKEEFDLCVCTEFAEHVEAKFEENWLVAVDRCKYLLLSAAPPGQGGYHHVNEQHDEYWINRFTERGFKYDAKVTAKLRATCERKTAPWGRTALMFFHNGNQWNPPSEVKGGISDRPEQPVSERDSSSDYSAILQLRNQALKEQLAAVYSSWSWRLTAPLRWMLDLFRR